jgi:arginine deiminase
MKLDFRLSTGGGPGSRRISEAWGLSCESAGLDRVLLARPDGLEPVPCCSVTREMLRKGHRTDPTKAALQHRALIDALQASGARVDIVAGQPGLPDMTYVRDVGLMTPWGYQPLSPGASHRRAEAALLADHVATLGIPVLPFLEGMIEGGDVSIFREGLVVIGCSGERTDAAGAACLGRMFERHGWRALAYEFDPHFLHLDTQFCALAGDRALACVDVLDEDFLDTLADLGIDLLPMSYRDARRLGCNVLAMGGGHVLAAAGTAAGQTLRKAGYTVTEIDLSEFTACGGGVHCLTLPLARH